eukprot:GHVU01070643.1.p1 GENE.GHVU01070643.1~~GHVU01070643.1.p1  ORF type:complete len:119 (-),score=9.00 GHVU01070643.1:291-647(-)
MAMVDGREKREWVGSVLPAIERTSIRGWRWRSLCHVQGRMLLQHKLRSWSRVGGSAAVLPHVHARRGVGVPRWWYWFGAGAAAACLPVCASAGVLVVLGPRRRWWRRRGRDDDDDPVL